MSLPESTNPVSGTTVERRTILRTAAWTAPVVALAVAAPAYAASRCVGTEFTVNFTTTGWSYNSSTRTGTISATPVNTPAPNTTMQPPALTFTNSFTGTMRAATSGTYANMAVSPDDVGGLGKPGLTMLQNRPNNNAVSTAYNSRQTLALSFDRNVTNLRITVTDIDAFRTGGTNQYRDIIALSATPTSTSTPNNSRVEAAGGTNRWRSNQTPSADASLDPVTDNRGNITFVFSGTTRNLSLDFWNELTSTVTNNGLQGIFISSITFDASSCR